MALFPKKIELDICATELVILIAPPVLVDELLSNFELLIIKFILSDRIIAESLLPINELL